MNRRVGCLTVLVLLVAMPAWAYDGIVEKKTFAMPAYATVGGTTIKGVRVGYETYGTLNAARDNVILVAHFYSGNSHAAGKYAASDPAPGYWDAIIGSGKPVDTDRFFVVSSDTLVNLNAKDPKTITTGPASINSDTGRPYGMSFPIVTIRDFVNVQKALLDSLGIKKLHAVMGASMGALQSFEWAAAYPDMVERIVPVIGAAELNAFGIGWLGVWAAPIMLDPRWNKGDYYGQEEPVEGLALALKIVTLHARHYGWASGAFGRKWAAAERDPSKSWDNKFAIEDTLDKIAWRGPEPRTRTRSSTWPRRTSSSSREGRGPWRRACGTSRRGCSSCPRNRTSCSSPTTPGRRWRFSNGTGTGCSTSRSRARAATSTACCRSPRRARRSASS